MSDPRSLPKRMLWWLLAWSSLGLGLLGILVPGLPTVPFVLLSAFAAARGSERLHRWLLAHAHFGPLIRDWQQHGTVSRRAKRMASVAMALSAGAMLVFAPRLWMALPPIACMSGVALWLWRRPEQPPTTRQE